MVKKQQRKAKHRVVSYKPKAEFVQRLDIGLAKKLLGWTEEGNSTFGTDFLLKDLYQKKVRCINNIRNRPLYLSNVEKLQQEILRGRWCFNGETRIIGKTGLVLNGQHTLIALVLANQAYEKDPNAYPEWSSSPTISTAIVYGVEEDDTTVNTMDTCKPRSLTDVYFRSDLLQKIRPKERKDLAGILSYGVKHIWYRTGYVKAFHPGLKDTHPELIAFGDNHPKILEAAQHIHAENDKEGKIGRLLRTGYACGMLYLMGCSSTNPTKYRKEQDEKHLSWKNWDAACDFFVLLANDADEVSPIKYSLQKIIDDGGDSVLVRTSVIAKAWNLYIREKQITKEGIALKFVEKDGWPVLSEIPTVGGIDLGDAAKNEEFQSEQVEKEKRAIRKRREQRKASTRPSSKKSKSTKTTTKAPTKLKGKLVWVVNGVDEPWQGRVLSLKDKSAEIKVSQGFQGAGNVKPVAVTHLRNKQPIAA